MVMNEPIYSDAYSLINNGITTEKTKEVFPIKQGRNRESINLISRTRTRLTDKQRDNRETT